MTVNVLVDFNSYSLLKFFEMVISVSTSDLMMISEMLDIILELHI